MINTAGVMFFVDAQPHEWYAAGGLVNNSVTMLMINAVLPPLVPYIDFGYLFKKRLRSKLTQEKINQWNAVAQRTPSTKDEAKERAKAQEEIAKYKNAFAPSPMNETRRYAVAIKVSLCCLLYMPLVPWLSLVGFLGMTLQYWMDKYLLLKWNHRPLKPASHHMAMFMIRFLKYVAPLGVTCAFWVFLTPSWRLKGEVYSNLIISVLVGSVFSFCISLSIWTSAIFSCLGRKEGLISDDAEEDYYKAQYMWPTEMKYHKDHFLLKPLPDSKNPEFLKPGELVEPHMEDVKGSYGAATQAEAESVGATPSVRLQDGRIIKPTVYGSPTVLPVEAASVGASAAVAPSPEPEAAKPDAAGAESSSPPTASAKTEPEAEKAEVAGPPPASVGSKSQGLWEYEVSHGWKSYDNDCQDHTERQYQKFLAKSGKDQIHVKTQGIELSINFKKMTQKRPGQDTIRKIQRRTE